jgi:DNA-binding protein H-NS
MSDELQTIEQQIADLQQKKKSILDNQRGSVLKETRQIIRLYGFNVAELGLGATPASAKADRPKPEAKYYNPDNPEQTWHGGKGPRPKWVAAFLASGRSRDEILIKK